LEAAGQARKMIGAFRAKGRPVIHFRHASIQPGADFLLPGTWGNEIHELVRPEAGEIVCPKHFPNAFRETPLLSGLREARIENLVIVEMMTFMCLPGTARAACDYGFRCTAVHDATAARAMAFQGLEIPAALARAAFHGALAFAYAEVLNTDACLQ
jgi:nicotinamidase-related amidase